MASKGYSVTTRKFILCSNHDDWFEKTQKLYNQVLLFYYQLYLDKLANQNLNNQETMRTLERLSIVGRDKQPVVYPLPWDKIPLYFRRAAINDAIASAKSYLSRENQVEQTQRFSQSVTFYKGTYRDFSEKEISLKVWNGENWCWLRCRLSGNYIPESAETMSPSVVIKGKRIELHMPVKEEVSDIRTAKQRMAEQAKICSVQFTNEDAAVVCCMMDSENHMEKAVFLRGGDVYAHQCRLILKKIEKSEKASGDDKNPKANQKYWMKLKHLSDYYSHKFSRQIVDFCRAQDGDIILLPKYDETYEKYVMTSVGNWSPLHLSYQIREKLKYKAWRAGILVLETEPHGTSSVCSKCGEPIKRQGKEYICKKDHHGNVYLNTAMNLGIKCRKSFRKQVKIITVL